MSDPREALQSALAAIIPGGELATMTLPDVPEMQLLLLAPDYPRGNLSAAEMQRIMDNPLYWVFCWASGQVLARYLLDNPARVRGRRDSCTLPDLDESAEFRDVRIYLADSLGHSAIGGAP